MAMEQDVPQGNVTLTAVDIISPESVRKRDTAKMVMAMCGRCS